VANHVSFDLNYHLVLATHQRKGIFNSSLGKRLSEYWLRVASKHGFAIDQISVVPDHIHMIVRIVPSMSIEECALLLMNNGQYCAGKHCPQVLIKNGNQSAVAAQRICGIVWQVYDWPDSEVVEFARVVLPSPLALHLQSVVDRI